MSQLHSRIWDNSRIGLAVLLCLCFIGSIVAPATVAAQAATSSTNVTEEAYRQPAPEPGDEYFEAAADDGSWVSYVNPRDEYRDPYLGDGSGKICTVLLNEAGDPIVGEAVPNTTVTVPTGDTLEWHSSADPMTVDYPLTDNYERPLDADQFGTADDLPQGDGYMDSHCIEFHGPAIGDEIEYGEATVDGDHADRIEVVGYIQRDGYAWDSDVDPVEAATSYEAAGGGWTYSEPTSHGQVVVVLQLAAAEPTENETVADVGANEATADNATAANSTGGDGPSTTDEAPGFGIVGGLVAILSLVIALGSRHR